MKSDKIIYYCELSYKGKLIYAEISQDIGQELKKHKDLSFIFDDRRITGPHALQEAKDKRSQVLDNYRNINGKDPKYNINPWADYELSVNDLTECQKNTINKTLKNELSKEIEECLKLNKKFINRYFKLPDLNPEDSVMRVYLKSLDSNPEKSLNVHINSIVNDQNCVRIRMLKNLASNIIDARESAISSMINGRYKKSIEGMRSILEFFVTTYYFYYFLNNNRLPFYAGDKDGIRVHYDPYKFVPLTNSYNDWLIGNKYIKCEEKEDLNENEMPRNIKFVHTEKFENILKFCCKNNNIKNIRTKKEILDLYSELSRYIHNKPDREINFRAIPYNNFFHEKRLKHSFQYFKRLDKILLCLLDDEFFNSDILKN